MSLPSLFSDLAARLQSPEFLLSARHVEHPNAFTRRRKLPLLSLVAMMLSDMRKCVQAELDTFFAHLQQQAQLVRHVSEQAFAQARAKLFPSAIPAPNDWLIERAEFYGFVTRRHGLRLDAADATKVRFGVRAIYVKRAALAHQIVFGLLLPGAELMLAASLQSVRGNGERQMLFEHLDRLSSTDLLLLDRGYPASWPVAALNQRQRPFCMRVDQTVYSGVQAFLCAGQAKHIVTLAPANHQDALDYGVERVPPTVRLVRSVSNTVQVRILMTNLLDTDRFPASVFGELQHHRWRIEDASKRLKHRLNLEHVSGLKTRGQVLH